MTEPTSDDKRHFQENDQGIYQPVVAVQHRNDEYDEKGFDTLREMQTKHFWYSGRHRFIEYTLKKMMKSAAGQHNNSLSMIDLGGGCGGWVHYLTDNADYSHCELALGDSSIHALEYAAHYVGPAVKRYQIDLLQLPWKDRWDVVFLLDVLEHIPNDLSALQQAYNALRPGGLLFVATPALKFFWTYNDELAHHVRRYSKKEFAVLAGQVGFDLRLTRYFMFLLSPLLYLSRIKSPDYKNMNAVEIRKLLVQTHRVPAPPVNAALKTIFHLETPAGVWIPFPWGTSILGVFQKPIEEQQ